MIRRTLLLYATSAAIFAPAAFAQTAPEDPQPTVPDPAPAPTDDPTPTTDDTLLPPEDTTVDVDVDAEVDVEPVEPVEPVRDDPTFMSQRMYTTTTTEEQRPTILSEWGFALAAGGGVSGFTSETARDATQDGGGWDVRATIGTRLPVSAEIAYIGSAQTIDALGLDDGAVLVGNGVQGNLRLNVMTESAVQPFIYAGAAWRRYDLANTDTNTSSVADHDDVVEFPVGAGIAYRYRGLLFDARGEFRAATNEDLMPSLAASPGLAGDDDNASLHRWGVTANLGIEL